MNFFTDERKWFQEARYGIFVHFGTYTMYEKQEQVLWRYGIPWKEYEKRGRTFNPSGFNAKEWLDLLEANGARYLVFTAKHHDGFCMWNTKETDWNIMNTPFRRDILKELADECHKRNFPLVVYYSVVDWHHPAYPNIGRSHEIKTNPKYHDEKAYLAFLKNQIREICTNYGKIHGIWWDMNVMSEHKSREINNVIRKLQPAAVINNRGFDEGDYSTPERRFGADPLMPFDAPTEACDSIGAGSWAYRKEEDYVSRFYMTSRVAGYLARGANFIMGVAPTADGKLSPQSQAFLRHVGGWMKKMRESLTKESVTLPGVPCPMTGNEKELNLFLTDPLTVSTLQLPKMDVKSAVLLNDGRELPLTSDCLSYVKGENDRKVTRIREIPIEEFPNEVLAIRLKGTFPKIRKVRKLRKCSTWFADLENGKE